MKIPLKILVGETLQAQATGETWGDIIDNWEAYAVLWNASNNLGVDPTLVPVLDTFGDEGISIKSMVKDMSDPKKLFTDFSRSFTVPASKKNNRIFKHYYNIDITNGLDSRELIPAKLLMNNTTFKIGNIRVEGARMSKGVAQSYKITFIGKLSELARQIGVDRLSSLDLSTYDKTTFDAETEMSNITKRPVMFPLSSRKERYVYHSTDSSLGIENARNIAYSGTTPADDYGIKDVDVVGAMAVGTLLDEIESKYGFNFTGAFTNNYVRELYLMLHQTDKERSGEALIAPVTGIVWNGGSTQSGHWTRNNASLVFNGTGGTPNTGGHQRYKITARGIWTGDVVIRMYEQGSEIRSRDVSGSYMTQFQAQEGATYTFTAESAGSISVDIEVVLELEVYEEEEQNVTEGYYGQQDYNLDGVANVGTAGTFLISKNMPKMKIIDFLSSLFKMFNIVAEVDGALNISTKHFDHFMSEGQLKDVTEHIEVDAYDVNRPNVYSSMQMEFADPKVALELGYLAVNGDQYGELSYELQGTSGVRLSGAEYKLKVDNQRIPVEPLTDLDDSTLTNVAYLLYSDLKAAEQSTKPSFTYLCRQTGADPIAFADNQTVTSITSYTTPSNSFNTNNNVPTADNSLVGLYFGEELNEYNTSNTRTGVGLWNNFYRGTTAMMFDEDKRRVKFNAHLPQGLILNLSLADTLLISNNFYNINSIETNYLTGVSKLDLTLVGRSELDQFNTGNWEVTNNGTTDLKITFMESSGGLGTFTISPSGTLSYNMVGGVIGFNHADFTQSLE